MVKNPRQSGLLPNTENEHCSVWVENGPRALPNERLNTKRNCRKMQRNAPKESICSIIQVPEIYGTPESAAAYCDGILTGYYTATLILDNAFRQVQGTPTASVLSQLAKFYTTQYALIVELRNVLFTNGYEAFVEAVGKIAEETLTNMPEESKLVN